jgi:hypothetical protein
MLMYRINRWSISNKYSYSVELFDYIILFQLKGLFPTLLIFVLILLHSTSS